MRGAGGARTGCPHCPASGAASPSVPAPSRAPPFRCRGAPAGRTPPALTHRGSSGGGSQAAAATIWRPGVREGERNGRCSTRDKPPRRGGRHAPEGGRGGAGQEHSLPRRSGSPGARAPPSGGEDPAWLPCPTHRVPPTVSPPLIRGHLTSLTRAERVAEPGEHGTTATARGRPRPAP